MPRTTAYTIKRHGDYVQLSNWISVKGVKPFKKANPFYYRKRSLAGTPGRQVSWNGYSGVIVPTYSNVGTTDDLSMVHSDLSYLRNPNRNMTSPDAALRDRCLEKVYDYLRGSSELLVDLAESRSTLKMLGEMLKAKRKVLRFVAEAIDPRKPSRKQKRKAARERMRARKKKPDLSAGGAISDVSGKWLEARYGIMPLLYSVYEAGENIHRHIFTQRIYVKKRAGWEGRQSQTYRNAPGQEPKVWFQTVHAQSRMEYGLFFKPPPRDVQQLANWTSLNPASIAWELVPLSFVADWFVNVGDQLRAWENHILYSTYFDGGYRSYSYREDRMGFYQEGPLFPVPEYWPNGDLVRKAYGSRQWSSGAGKFLEFDRSLVTSLPRPAGVRVTINLNAKRFVDAAALIQGSLRRLF